MHKTWNVTLYRDGQPVAHRRGVDHAEALAQIYRLSRTATPVEEIAEELASSDAEIAAV